MPAPRTARTLEDHADLAETLAAQALDVLSPELTIWEQLQADKLEAGYADADEAAATRWFTEAGVARAEAIETRSDAT